MLQYNIILMSINNLLDSTVLPYEVLNVYSINSEYPGIISNHQTLVLPTNGNGYTATNNGGLSAFINFTWPAVSEIPKFYSQGNTPSELVINADGHYRIKITLPSGASNNTAIAPSSSVLITAQTCGIQLFRTRGTSTDVIAVGIQYKDSYVAVNPNSVPAASGSTPSQGGYSFSNLNLDYIGEFEIDDILQIRLINNCTTLQFSGLIYNANYFSNYPAPPSQPLYPVPTDLLEIDYLG